MILYIQFWKKTWRSPTQSYFLIEYFFFPGLFILCWLPFFTMYLIRPFCDNCIDPLLFSMFFWLGYCNSAVNPMIYALFSKDFRFAFKRLICNCCCRSNEPWGRATSRRDSEMSQLKHGGRTPSITPSANAHSLDENSDPTDATHAAALPERWRSYAALSISSTSSGAGGSGVVCRPSRGPVYDICHPLVMTETTSSSASEHHLMHASKHLNVSQTITINSIGSKYPCNNVDLLGVTTKSANLWWFSYLNLLNLCMKKNR